MNDTMSQDKARVPPVRSDARDRAPFKQFPLLGQAQLSFGSVPTPCHVYDGRGLFVTRLPLRRLQSKSCAVAAKRQCNGRSVECRASDTEHR
jgi:hypothetical protein